jgi:hypothetical protein
MACPLLMEVVFMIKEPRRRAQQPDEVVCVSLALVKVVVVMLISGSSQPWNHDCIFVKSIWGNAINRT